MSNSITDANMVWKLKTSIIYANVLCWLYLDFLIDFDNAIQFVETEILKQ